MNRIEQHPILGQYDNRKHKIVIIYVDDMPYEAVEGEMIAAALLANGVSTFRYTQHGQKPRGIFCGIGRCTDCIMTVDNVPNVRTCVTPVKDGMRILTQSGTGIWSAGDSHV